MLQFIESADDVVALVIADKVTSADLDAVMDRLELAMARHAKVHVFVETRALDGMELTGLGGYIARAMPLFGQLRQFGRVAVVSDQVWVRSLSRVESALLPFVGYRVVEPAQRDEALAWVMAG